MVSQHFLWISALVALGFAILFLYPRSRPGPSRLRMTGGKKVPNVPARQGSSQMSSEARVASNDGVRVKSLNVMFNYNGHSWDAHEVLGVPAGAPMEMVEEAYQKTLTTTDASAHDFINTAYHAICNELKNH